MTADDIQRKLDEVHADSVEIYWTGKRSWFVGIRCGGNIFSTPGDGQAETIAKAFELALIDLKAHGWDPPDSLNRVGSST